MHYHRDCISNYKLPVLEYSLMSTEKINRTKKVDQDRGLVMLISRLLIGKLQKGLSLLAARGPGHDEFDDRDQLEVAAVVPEDVKEGHFAVFAVMGNETKRFVVKLECLNNPAFFRLLEQAKEEYGFGQKGALAVPCRPEELHRILENRRREQSCTASAGEWSTCNNILTAIEGY